jgi:hypothetical protein
MNYTDTKVFLQNWPAGKFSGINFAILTDESVPSFADSGRGVGVVVQDIEIAKQSL